MSVFETFSAAVFGTPVSGAGSNPSSPYLKSPTAHVNMTPRSTNRPGSRGHTAAISSLQSPGAEDSPQQLISSLQNEMYVKDSIIASLQSRVAHLEDESRMKKTGGKAPIVRESVGGGVITHRQNAIPLNGSHIISDKGRTTTKIGTRESLLTSKILEAMPEPVKTKEQLLAEKFISVFQHPLDNIAYLQSAVFASDLIMVCEAVEELLEDEPRVVFMQSPVYVIGDIHGNLEDLHFFADNIWKMGIDLTAGKFLFLGDYVDRGMSSLECVAYLFGLKLLHPRKVFLLRGNHETRDVRAKRFGINIVNLLIIYLLSSFFLLTITGQWLGGALPRKVFHSPVQGPIWRRAR